VIKAVALKMRSIFFHSNRALVASILSLTLAKTITTIIQAFLLSNIIMDIFQSEKDFQEMWRMMLWLGLTFILRAILAFISEKNIDKKSNAICAQLRSEIINSISKYGAALEKKFGVEEIAVVAVHEIATVRLYLTQFIPKFTTTLLFPILSAIVITLQDLISGALLLITLTLIAISKIFISSASSPIILQRSQFKISLFDLITTVLLATNLAQVAYRLSSGDISPSNGLITLILLLQIYHPLSILSISSQDYLFKIYLDGERALVKINEITSFEDKDLGEITNIGKFKELRWTDSSADSGDGTAISFRWGIASAGKLTVIAGSDRAGKTALIDSIIRLRDLKEGRIFIEGSKDTYRVDQLDLGYWLRQITWVPQSPNFASGTIEENFKLIRPRTNRESLIDLLAQVNLNVEELSEGLSTKICNEQGGLSPSQLKRLAIARVILKDSAIVIVDDLSTSLDIENQKFFHVVLKEFARKGKVVVAITENEDLINLADRLLTFDSPKELVRS
jgi:ABC-type transport system involved in cytochrome bd biosynthesis fused ATPase/permease subunit